MDAVRHQIPHRAAGVTLLAAMLALAGCGLAEPGIDYRPSDAARAAPPPRLLTQEEIAAGRAAADAAARPDAAEERADLAARAARLRARAAALSAPVLAPEESARLQAACLPRPEAGIDCPP